MGWTKNHRYVTLQFIKSWVHTVSLNTYDSARGFGLGCHSGMASVSDSELSERMIFPFLDASASRSAKAPLFFFPPLRGELLSSSSSSSSSPSWKERASVSSDAMSEVPLRRRPLLASLPFFLAFFSGAWYGAGTSIFIKRGIAGSSGSGAGHWIRSAFFVQPRRM